MAWKPINYPANKPDLYRFLESKLKAIVEGVPHRTANLANASALLNDALEGINWVGFYLLEGDKLVLGPFQGNVACVEISVGKGVCGAAVERGETIVVEDVHLFPGHIACDSASASEIVVPLWKEGRVAAVLDIDSPRVARFTPEDREGLEKLGKVLEKLL